MIENAWDHTMGSTPSRDHKIVHVADSDEQEVLSRQLSELMKDQRFGVLSSSSKDGWPYGNLISFAVTDDLLGILFVTPRDTMKFANICNDGRISMLITDQRNDPLDIDHAVSLTVMGTAREVKGSERETSIPVIIGKHPELASFIRSPMNALIRIDVARYIHVSQFQMVKVWELGESRDEKSRTR